MEAQRRVELKRISVLQRIEKDLCEKPKYYFNKPYRVEWKSEAMRRTANKHRSDYEKEIHDVSRVLVGGRMWIILFGKGSPQFFLFLVLRSLFL
jgi:DNA segregation ATPase FtsK/SpoIIIE-like protein